jgi:hypothetical protein
LAADFSKLKIAHYFDLRQCFIFLLKESIKIDELENIYQIRSLIPKNVLLAVYVFIGINNIAVCINNTRMTAVASRMIQMTCWWQIVASTAIGLASANLIPYNLVIITKHR